MARSKGAERKSLPPIPRRIAAQPSVRMGFLVHDVSRTRRTMFDQAVKRLGITRAQWWALANLSRHEPEGMIQADLARLLDVGKVTVGGLIDRLESSGYVVRRLDPEDRRLRRVFITEAGYEIIDQMQSISRELNSVIMAGVRFDHVAIAEDVLHTMKVNIRNALDVSGYDATGEGAEPHVDDDPPLARASRRG